MSKQPAAPPQEKTGDRIAKVIARAGVCSRRDAEKLIEAGREIYGREPEFVSEIGPVIGAHAGPGLIGVTAMRGDLLGPI